MRRLLNEDGMHAWAFFVFRLMQAWTNASIVSSASLAHLLGDEVQNVDTIATMTSPQPIGVASADYIWISPYELKFHKLDCIT